MALYLSPIGRWCGRRLASTSLVVKKPAFRKSSGQCPNCWHSSLHLPYRLLLSCLPSAAGWHGKFGESVTRRRRMLAGLRWWEAAPHSSPSLLDCRRCRGRRLK